MATFINNLFGLNKHSFDGISGQIMNKVADMNNNHKKFVTEINNKLNILNVIVTQTKRKINRNNQLISEQPDNIEDLQKENTELQQQLENIEYSVNQYLLTMDYSKDNTQILDRINTILENQPVGNAVTINREPIENNAPMIRGTEQLAEDKQEDEEYLRAFDPLNLPPGPPPPGPLNLPPGNAVNPDHSSGIKGGYVYKSPFRSHSTKKHNKSSRITRTRGGRYRRKKQTKFKRRYSIF